MTVGTAYPTLRLGWERLQDDEFTSGAPKTLSADTLTPVPVNSAQDEQEGATAVWVPSTSRLFPLQKEDFYWLVLRLTVTSPVGTGNFIEVTLDTSVNGDATTIDDGLIYCDSKAVLFPSGIDQCMTFTMGIPATQQFIDNGGLLRIRSPIVVDTFDYSLIANRTFNVK